MFSERIFYYIKIVSINNSCFCIGICPFEIPAIVGVDVSVEEKFRLIFFHQRTENGETPVGQVFHVINMIGRRMGDKNVEALVLP